MIRRPEEPAQPLTTTRLGGSSSARGVALIVLGLLVGVVAVGIAGRPPADPPAGALSGLTDASASQQPRTGVHLQPTSANATNGAPSSATPRPSRRPVPLKPIRPLGEDQFAVTGTIGERRYWELLEEIEPGRLYGIFRIPFPRPAKFIRLQIAQLWTREDRMSHVPIEQLRLPLDHLAPETRLQGVLLDASVPARPRAVNSPRPVRLGYTLVIRAESRLSFGVLTFDLTMGDSAA